MLLCCRDETRNDKMQQIIQKQSSQEIFFHHHIKTWYGNGKARKILITMDKSMHTICKHVKELLKFEEDKTMRVLDHIQQNLPFYVPVFNVVHNERFNFNDISVKISP
jgi:hypothetical protein